MAAIKNTIGFLPWGLGRHYSRHSYETTLDYPPPLFDHRTGWGNRIETGLTPVALFPSAALSAPISNCGSCKVKDGSGEKKK
ncbi:hypothetical protein RRG08_048447 [Elysia crispata]|uniref:Uncharacterized protein n=1 Tax=Elysia crispata TaxID=231223 RepID=A0AAE1B965_9GAST|nr:hypothetical protein RRG08_048447 [Elysia crispata]